MSELTVYFTVKYTSEDGKYTSEKYSFPTREEAELYIEKINAKFGDRNHNSWHERSFYSIISITEENYGLPPSD
jgi:hypothetical protein